MQYVFLLLVTVLACGCQFGKTPTRAITPTAISGTYARITLYFQQHGQLPTDLSALPPREGYSNRIEDAWNRPLIYKIESAESFELSSLGADGVVGGDKLNADLIRRYRLVNGNFSEAH